MTEEEIKALVQKAAADLGEHFESVRIFVSWPHEDKAHVTKTYDDGTGNWYASYGQIRQWILMEEERMRAAARKEFEEDE